MKIEILTTTKKSYSKKYGTSIKPNLDIKSINGKPFKAYYKYMANGYCLATIEY